MTSANGYISYCEGVPVTLAFEHANNAKSLQSCCHTDNHSKTMRYRNEDLKGLSANIQR